MKLIFSLFTILFVCFAPNPRTKTLTRADNTVTIHHKYYSSSFDTVMHYPVVVEYWLTRAMLQCDSHIKRTNRFKPDPQLPDETNLQKDYTRSGYDRGHNMPAEDNRCDLEGMKECFYYSNMTPQTHRLNAGPWKMLEEHERAEALQYDSVLVWCGSVAGKMKIGRVTVPSYCWKMLWVMRKDTLEYYSFSNDSSESRLLETYKVSEDSVERLTGMTFWPDRQG